MIDVILGPIDNMIHSLAKMLGNPDDQTKLLILIFAAYPLGYLFRFISGKWTRHAYSILAGVMIHYIMFREQVIHFWLLGLIVYLIISFIDRKIQAPIVFIVWLAHLSIVHIMRVIYDYGGWSIDCSTFLMPLVSRLSSLGYCYYDGIEERKNDLLEEQESRKLIRKPTLIEILSYVSFPASNLCGPFFEFRDYIDFIEENGRFQNIPSSFRHVSRSLFLGIINIILCIVLIDSFNIFDIAKEEMMNKPFIYTNN